MSGGPSAVGPGSPRYGRILLKLSGEALLGNRQYGVDPQVCAFIASQVAAAVYGARTLRTHLEDHHENFTRFLLLSRKAHSDSKADKVSIVFSTPNVPGALYKCLSVFALRDIDLSKMESRPLRGRPWEYFFYLDFIGNVREDRCRKALDHLSEVTNFLRVLGCYKSAER